MNAATGATEKLRCDTLDVFHSTLKEAVQQLGVSFLQVAVGVSASGASV